jgi:hypothetical protein
MTTLSKFIAAIALAAPFAAPLSAQTLPFLLVAEDQNQNVTPINNGATLNIASSSVGSKIEISIGMTYIGVNQANFGTPSLFGSSAFSAGSLTMSSLIPSSSATLPINFIPISTTAATAQLTLPYTITGPAGGGAGQGSTPLSQGVITLTLAGGTPQFVISYYIQSVQNVMPVADGGTVTFPPTPIGSSSQAVIQIGNNGSAAGLINSIQATGSAFRTSGVPLLPGSLNVGSTLQIGITYTPTQSGNDTGTLVITFPDHTVTLTLSGSGAASAYTYQFVLNGQSTTVTPNQTLSFSSTPGVPVLFSVVVTNAGTSVGTIAGVSLVGTGYQQVDTPPSLSLAPGSSLSLDYAFTPPSVGSFPGRLRVGNDLFVLAGSGTGPQLMYSFSIGSVTLSVLPGGTAPFPTTGVEQTESGTFTIQNTGTSPATVVSVSIPSAASAFTLVGGPTSATTLAPNASMSFTIDYTPFATSSTAVLQIDSAMFNLTGAATGPPSLPAYQFTGPSGSIAALQQTPIGLTLSSPYTVAVTGTLTIVQNPQSFSADPSVQFSTGGASVTFNIPAKSTQAIFPNGSTTVLLQTGSIANSITLKPTFVFGAFDLTPTNAPTLQFTVPAAAPQLSNVVITQTSATGFTLQIAGVSTSRSLMTLNFTFTAASSYTLSQTSLPVDVSSVSNNWFQSGASNTFGGQFVITAPFTLTTGSTTATSATNPSLLALQSVSVTAVNAQGTSNSVSTQF